MVRTQHLSDKWIKASILGTIWAASEIVLGSFLHNLRIPFSGNILTAIGIIILISASYKWDEKGVFWRAGVICALLKTMSPSAVIFGPMIAILSEAILLEISTRVLGRTIPGFIIGSILAMSWNLLQKVVKLVIFYGNNIVEVYTDLMNYAERQMGLQFDAVWTPLVLLLFVQIFFGITAALIGLRTGGETIDNPISFQKNTKYENTGYSKKLNNFSHSISWLVLNIVIMIGLLVLIGRINFALWVVLVVATTTVWAFRYKRALRQLVRPRLWIFFVIITMITAFVFSKLQSETETFGDALLIGVEMNLRAIVLLMGFTVLGTELYNPKIRNYFARSYFKQLPLAIQLSLESLPTMIANTPDLKSIIKNPTLFVHQIMSFADFRLNEIKNRSAFKQKVFVITGGVGQGKTTCIKNLIASFLQNKIPVSGIYSSRILENKNTIGYDVVDITTRKSSALLRKTGDSTQERIGNFYIYNEGFDAGKKTLKNSKTKIVIIDEIGRLETSGKGWFEPLNDLIESSGSHLILTVRNEFVNQVSGVFKIEPVHVFDLSTDIYSDISLKIIEDIGTIND